MLILHVSDIHFRMPDCLHPDTDADRPFRTRLVQDARERVQELGPVDAILVGGDVAFRGAPQEYDVAFEWIRELAASTRCPIERVFVVPGNHDVDRGVIARSAEIKTAQQALSAVEAGYRERTLRNMFADPIVGRTLLEPQAAYNEFAKRFGCQVYAPERLYWKQDIPFDDGCTLRISGLTSTLLSGIEGGDDKPRDLYLSPMQTVFDPVDNVVNLVLCHHPPDWLMDGDDATDAINGRAQIQLFGHKHRQRISREYAYIRFSAGAVNPDRQEAGWSPGYNLFELSLEGAGQNRRLQFNCHLRQWQTNPDLYRPIVAQDGAHIFRHSIPFPEPAASKVLSSPAFATQVAGSDVITSIVEVADPEAAMGDESTRNLVFRFWNLTVSQRRTVAQKLGLIDQSEMSLPEPERYGRVLRRASERGELGRLAEEISMYEL